MSDNVTLARDGATATVTLNRPDRRNSLSDPMLTDLAAAFAELRDDGATRVVIVTGAPPVFSAGAGGGRQSGAWGQERPGAPWQRKGQIPPALRGAPTLLPRLWQGTMPLDTTHPHS